MTENNSKIPAIACEAASQPWAMMADWFPKVLRELAAHGDEDEDEAMASLLEVHALARVAVVYIHGALFKGAPDWYARFGIINHDLVMRICDELASEAGNIETVIFSINSPGGTVNGTLELAHRIESLREAGITTLAYTDRLCGSAGYQLACACEAIFAAPTARVGSIGTIVSFPTDKGFWEQMGFKWETFTSSPLKAIGYPGRGLNSEEREWMQQQINQSGQAFFEYVRSHRAGIAEAAFNGQAFQAQFGPEGLVDSTDHHCFKDFMAAIASGNI